jgi:hypothetical protein
MAMHTLRKKINYILWFFIIALLLSGLTAFPIRWEINVLRHIVDQLEFFEKLWPAMTEWIYFLHQGINVTAQLYPFMFYGTDWLAFAHIVIAIAFIGPLRDPVKNIWVVEFGMIACVLIIPLAMICGPIRGIPFCWRLFDSCFGIFGIIPLWIVHRYIKEIMVVESEVCR